MENSDKAEQINALMPGVVDAIDAMFDLIGAIEEDGLTIRDLTEGVKLAIEDGHDRAIIAMTMMTIAIERAKPQ